MLRIHNSLTRTKEAFEPIEPGKVRMYVCGMTVYDYCHIGHARMVVAFDLVQRWLRASGYDVTYVRNITDIEDKIIRRAVENGETIRALTDRFIAAMNEDLDALGVQRPDHEPRATEYVPQMIDLIGRLQDNGLAYVGDAPADGGEGGGDDAHLGPDVNFAVRAFPRYGRLSGKSLDDLRAGERVAVDDGKRDPLDFVLWKSAKRGEPAEARWPSPWGEGRPGWHIECSAMSTSLLGPTLDIHGGGPDLQFPHHENEIAQSEGAFVHGHEGRFANLWMHNGFVRVDDEKMSKSLGNFFTIRDVLKRYDAEVIRLFILRAHYRSPLNYADEHLEDARVALLRLYNALTPGAQAAASIDWQRPYPRRVREALDDDFNSPIALAVLFEMANELNRAPQSELEAELRALGALMGLLERDPVQVRQSGLHGSDTAAGGLDDAQIEARIAERLAARKARDFARADAIRDALQAAGIQLEDGAAGTSWRRV